MKKRNRRVLDNSIRCMGRKIDGKQCTRSRLKDCDFCKSHKDNLAHGRVDDPNYSKNKIYTGILFNEQNTSNIVEDNSSFNLTKKTTSDNIQLSPGKKRMLEFLKKNTK